MLGQETLPSFDMLKRTDSFYAIQSLLNPEEDENLLNELLHKDNFFIPQHNFITKFPNLQYDESMSLELRKILRGKLKSFCETDIANQPYYAFPGYQQKEQVITKERVIAAETFLAATAKEIIIPHSNDNNLLQILCYHSHAIVDFDPRYQIIAEKILKSWGCEKGKNNPKINKKNSNGHTAYSLCAVGTDIICSQVNEPLQKLLLEYEADPNIADNHGAKADDFALKPLGKAIDYNHLINDALGLI